MISRLKKAADFENNDQLENSKDMSNSEAQLLLQNITDSVNIMVNQMKEFVESVNELNQNNTDVYNELKMLAKLPDESYIQELVKLEDDVNNAIKILGDKGFLNSITD